jgi:hypothetical protein
LSDTCDLTIYILPHQQPIVVAAFGVEPAELHDLADGPRPRLLLVFDDVEPHRTLEHLARQGLTFEGSHGDGADYPGRQFAAHGKELATVDKPFGVLSVPIDPNTQRVDEAALAGLAAYQRVIARVREDFRREPPLDVSLSALRLDEAGPEEAPWQRLLGSIRLAGVHCHLEAIAVEQPSDQRTQRALATDLARPLDLVAEAFDSQNGFQTRTLWGSDGHEHDYVLLVHPYDR